MIIKGQRISLRLPDLNDVDDLLKWENDPEVWKYSDVHQTYSRSEIAAFVSGHHNIHLQKQLRLMICKADDSRSVGCIDLFEFDGDNKRAGLGILVYEKEDRRQGFGLEAVEMMKDYSRDQLNLHQLFCNVQADNEASMRLFKKAGFEEIGTKKDWRKTAHGWEHECIMQIILD